MNRRSLFLGILMLHCITFARAADVAALIEQQIAAGQLTIKIPAGDPGQFDLVTFSNLRAEVRSCRGFVQVSGNIQTGVNWLALRDDTIDLSGPLVSASAFTLAYPTIANIKWVYATPQTPLLQFGAAVNVTIQATKTNAGVQFSQLHPTSLSGRK